ncbi:metalloprotease m41 ftsh [Holotrichia oblita]|nr:metalloprotease m41 ftsh [Holotrichia oblita]
MNRIYEDSRVNMPSGVKYIIDALYNNGFEAYAVGGCIRDSLLGKTPHDWDITTSATPEAVMNIFKSNRTIPTGLQHGTVTVVIQKQPYEVTTYRVDGNYTDGRRPENIEYSQFVKLVKSHSVKKVQIDADKILVVLKTDASQEIVSQILKSDEADSDKTDPSPIPSLNQFSALNQDWDSWIKDNNILYTGNVGDSSLTNMLLQYDVDFYTPITTTNPIMDFFVTWILPMVIFYVILSFIMRYASKKMFGDSGIGGTGGLMNIGKSNAKLYNIEKKTGVRFADVAGQEEAKESLTEIVDFLHNPEKYTTIGAKQPKGALLIGPPGTGKTLLAKAVAGEANVPFFSLSGSEFVEMFVGVGASRVRDLFQQANKNAPCIIFIDEIDAIGKSRDNQIGGNDEREQTLNQLLAEMDGFDSSKGIMILAATNRPEILDKALLRPGRFDRRIIVEKPDVIGREAILEVHAKKVTTSQEVDLKQIALATSGAAGADLANMVNEAALRAVRMGRKEVLQEDLMEAVEVVIAGKEKKDRILSQSEKRFVAYHEVGHALASALQKNSQPIQKITIVPRTMGSLGYTMQMPEEEKYLMTKDEITAQIVTLLAGRAAEEVEFNSETTGASNDIERATKLARNMVSQYGMSKKFGMMGLESIESKYLDGRSVATCSDATGAELDKEVLLIITGAYSKAIELLNNNRNALTNISEFLIEKETISGEQFMDILNKTNGTTAEFKEDVKLQDITDSDRIIYSGNRRDGNKCDDYENKRHKDNCHKHEPHDDNRCKNDHCKDEDGYEEENCDNNHTFSQRHTHEYLGSVKIAEATEDPHNHRFAGVTGQAIPLSGGSHYHRLEDKTDFYEDHFHIVCDKTGPAIFVGNGKHIHFVEGNTTTNDQHHHQYQFATLIDNPIGD